MTRAKLAGLRRNLAVAIGNSGDADAVAALDEHARRRGRQRTIRSSASTSSGRRRKARSSF